MGYHYGFWPSRGVSPCCGAGMEIGPYSTFNLGDCSLPSWVSAANAPLSYSTSNSTNWMPHVDSFSPRIQIHRMQWSSFSLAINVHVAWGMLLTNSCFCHSLTKLYPTSVPPWQLVREMVDFVEYSSNQPQLTVLGNDGPELESTNAGGD